MKIKTEGTCWAAALISRLGLGMAVVCGLLGAQWAAARSWL
jgi:hypothetical protein